MAEIETVEIVNDAAKSGFTRINLCDFDPAIHVLLNPDKSDAVTLDEGDSVVKQRGRPRKVV